MVATLHATVSSTVFMYIFLFDTDFTEVYFSIMSSWKHASIGLGYGLVPSRQRAITRIIDDPVNCRIYASSGLRFIK